MRAKFHCGSIEKFDPRFSPNEVVHLEAVAADENLENQDFNKATPNGKLELWIDNPKAIGFFQPGKNYYLDFEEAE